MDGLRSPIRSSPTPNECTDIPRAERVSLRQRRDLPRHGQHPGTSVAVVALQQADDPLRVLLGLGCCRQDLEPRRQHLLPVDPDLPGPCLVCEEDDIVQDRRPNIRISSKDLETIQKRAMEQGLPYQTLISSLLHKYASGRLKEA